MGGEAPAGRSDRASFALSEVFGQLRLNNRLIPLFLREVLTAVLLGEILARARHGKWKSGWSSFPEARLGWEGLSEIKHAKYLNTP